MKEKNLSRPIAIGIIVVVVIGIVLFNMFMANNNSNKESKIENQTEETKTKTGKGKKYLEGEGYTPVQDENLMYFYDADLTFFNSFYSDGNYEVVFYQSTVIKLMNKEYKFEAIDKDNNLLDLDVVEEDTRYDDYYGLYFKNYVVNVKTTNQPITILIEADDCKYSYNIAKQD